MAHAHKDGKIILSGCFIVNDKKEVLLLYRDDHKHYETPGGKVRLRECSNPENPTIEDLAKTAQREVYEELGDNIKLAELSYFGKVEFMIPDGRKSIANKFLTRIVSGKPRLNEPDKFSKMDYLPVDKLEEYPISPDLQLFLEELKSHVVGKREIYQAKILVRYEGKYLLLKKVRDIHSDYVGGWEVPGGKIKPNEDPTKASLREIQEETGLDCRIITELKFLELEKDGIRTHTHVYLAEAPNDKVKLSDEHSDYMWVTYGEIDNLENVIYRDLFKQYVKEADKVAT